MYTCFSTSTGRDKKHAVDVDIHGDTYNSVAVIVHAFGKTQEHKIDT